MCFVACLIFFAQTLLLICCCCVSAKIARAEFCRLVEFCDAVGSCLLLVKLFACIMRVLVHVLCSHCSSFDFFGDACQDMMCGEISRPRGPTNHTCLRPPVPILPCFVVIVHHCTHTHRHTPIYNHLHPYTHSYINSYVLKIVSCFQIYILKVH